MQRPLFGSCTAIPDWGDDEVGSMSGVSWRLRSRVGQCQDTRNWFIHADPGYSLSFRQQCNGCGQQTQYLAVAGDCQPAHGRAGRGARAPRLPSHVCCAAGYFRRPRATGLVAAFPRRRAPAVARFARRGRGMRGVRAAQLYSSLRWTARQRTDPGSPDGTGAQAPPAVGGHGDRRRCRVARRAAAAGIRQAVPPLARTSAGRPCDRSRDSCLGRGARDAGKRVVSVCLFPAWQ